MQTAQQLLTCVLELRGLEATHVHGFGHPCRLVHGSSRVGKRGTSVDFELDQPFRDMLDDLPGNIMHLQ